MDISRPAIKRVDSSAGENQEPRRGLRPAISLTKLPAVGKLQDHYGGEVGCAHGE